MDKMKEKPSYPPQMAGWIYQYKRAEKLEVQQIALVKALRNLVNNLPQSEIELAREVWGNTNTRIISDARKVANQLLVTTKEKHGNIY